MLRDFERERIGQALTVWLEDHPTPDDPAFHVAQTTETLTPRQIVSSVLENDELGRQILAMLEYSVRRSSLEEVARDFESIGRLHPPEEGMTSGA